MKPIQKHILFLCSRLDLPGGTERAVVNTANLISSRGHKVSIFILDETDKSFFKIDPSVYIYTYQLHFGITSKGNTITRKFAFLKHLWILKKKIEEQSPDIIIGTEYPFTIAAGLITKNKAIHVFAWEHHNFYWLKRNRFWNFLHKKIYRRLDAVITLNKTEQQSFINYGCKAVVIPNFVVQQTRAKLDNPLLLSVGWLNWRKGVDRLPAIAERVFQKHPNWKWRIIGDGDMQEEVKRAIIENGLKKNMSIVEPFSNDLTEEYKQASLYVMTSRFECFPMVLLEAMSFGIPCISFDCPTGPSDIIQNDSNGMLIENDNIDAMINAIAELIEKEEKRKIMGANAFKSIEKFSPENIYQLWEKLFDTYPGPDHSK